MTMKYIKPTSLTWWAALIPLLCGVVQIVSPEMPGLTTAGDLVRAIYGDMTPQALINVGLGGIGLRAAFDSVRRA